MKRFELVSDLHLDFYDSESVLENWEAQTSTLVIAGDLCEMRNFDPYWIDILKSKWQNVVYVPGNHDYYGRSLDPNALDALRLQCHVLTRNSVSLDGIEFAGCTLWFPHPLRNRVYERGIADFSMIRPYGGIEFYEDVDREHDKDKEFLQWVKADVWVTHHMPFAQSIHPKYAGDPLNKFFYAQCDDLIDTCVQAPQVVVHGHTHEPMDYKVASRTHVVCNPMGYPGENRRYGPFAPRVIEF